MTAPYGEPPEVTKGAEAAADALWASLEKETPDSIDRNQVKPRVIQALRLAFSHGALLVMQLGAEAFKQINDKKPRRPIN